MTKELKWASIVLVALIIIYGINRLMQNQLVTKTDDVFGVEKEDVWEISFGKNNESLTLKREGDNWKIVGSDSLVMRSGRMDNLFNKVLKVKRETLISNNPEKWSTYSVDDSLGSLITLLDAGKNEVGKAIFGRSKSDWSHNYVRIPGENDVYLTSENVVYLINTTPTYWGEVPKPPEPDSTAIVAP